MKLINSFSNGYFMYSNLGTADSITIPPTPVTGLPSEIEDSQESNIIVRKIVEELECNILTTEEKEGREIHDIIPIMGKEADYSNEGSQYFPFHVEVPQCPLEARPDYLMLYCLRGNPKANTFVLPISSLLSCLSFEVREVMRQPVFAASYGASFGTRGSFVTEMIHENGFATIDLAEMYGITAEAQNALEEVKRAIEENFDDIVYTVNLKAGDVVVIDNKRCLHARNDFSREVGKDIDNRRWLKRCYLVRK